MRGGYITFGHSERCRRSPSCFGLVAFPFDGALSSVLELEVPPRKQDEDRLEWM